MNYSLSINTGFAVNRYSEPEEWIRIVGSNLGLKKAQFTADMLNPSLPDPIIKKQIERINNCQNEYGVDITSTFTGAFTRVNHLAHPDRQVRDFWVEWFKRFVDITTELRASSMGSHFGIFTHKDNDDPVKRKERRAQNIEGWHQIGKYAKQKGLEYLSWEPMSISREQGETIESAKDLQNDVNHKAPLPFYVCLDVDHGEITSINPDDTDPYVWLKEFAKEAPLIHLKQSSSNKSGHWPFTKEHNRQGRIIHQKVIDTLTENGSKGAELILELSFRERNPIDQKVVEVLHESVSYWRNVVTQ